MRFPEIRVAGHADLKAPVELADLPDLAYNLWWTWSPKAYRLFHSIDPERWLRYHNPVEVLLDVEPARWERLLLDRRFLDDYHTVTQELKDYLCYQTGALREFIRAAGGGDLQHTKPHGILYSMIEKDEALATAVAESARESGKELILMALGSGKYDRLARKMGATRAVNVTKEKLDNVMKDLGMQEGFDVGLEMSGNPTAFRDMLRTMHHGGSVAMLGVPSEDIAIDWNQVIFKGLTIKGIYGRQMFETWYKMAALLQSGLNVRPVITHQLPFTEFATAFEIMGGGQSGKIVMDWALETATT